MAIWAFADKVFCSGPKQSGFTKSESLDHIWDQNQILSFLETTLLRQYCTAFGS